MANGDIDPFEELRRSFERLFGYPPGSFDPTSNFLRDMERINKALGEGFTLLQSVMNPETLRERMEAFHPDQAVRGVNKAAQDLLKLPLSIWKEPPEETDNYRMRY